MLFRDEKAVARAQTNTSIRFWGGLPNEMMQSYLTVFAASNLARYRPILWHSVLVGEKPEQSLFAVKMRHALLKYALYGVNSKSLLDTISCLMRDIMSGKLEFKGLSS